MQISILTVIFQRLTGQFIMTIIKKYFGRGKSSKMNAPHQGIKIIHIWEIESSPWRVSMKIKTIYGSLILALQWFIDPFHYIEPEFHEEGMNSLYQASAKSLSKPELIHYYKKIKQKIEKYLDELTDELLAEFPEGCKFNRLTLILAQSRHLMYHIGFIHSIIFQNTGVWPIIGIPWRN